MYFDVKCNHLGKELKKCVAYYDSLRYYTDDIRYNPIANTLLFIFHWCVLSIWRPEFNIHLGLYIIIHITYYLKIMYKYTNIYKFIL